MLRRCTANNEHEQTQLHMSTWINFTVYVLTHCCPCSVRLWSGSSEHKDSGWGECHSWHMALAGQHAHQSSGVSFPHLWRDPHQWPVGTHSSPLHHNVRETHQLLFYFLRFSLANIRSLHRFKAFVLKKVTSPRGAQLCSKLNTPPIMVEGPS